MGCVCLKNPYDNKDLNDTRKSNNDIIKSFCSNCKYMQGKKFIGLCRIKHVFPYIYWGNILIVAAMILIFVLWITYKITFNSPDSAWWILGVAIGIVCALFPVFLGFYFANFSKGKNSIHQNVEAGSEQKT